MPEDMTLDAVRSLNPRWLCWREPTPMDGRYYAEREGYGKVSAADPEDLHTAILRAEYRVAPPLPQPSADLPSGAAGRAIQWT